MLGPLAFNGGPTPTMALAAGSPAIDAGNDAICSGPPINGVDQRGFTRQQGAHCDIGAYERDQTPPVLTLPQNITVDATSPAGAIVTFTATATDEYPSNPPVACTPSSGGVFPIGSTTVDCEASDAVGNTATGSFTVTVKGATEQLADLEQLVMNLGPGLSLAQKVDQARAAVSAGDTGRASSMLSAFISEVTAQTGKKIPADTAAQLIAAAKQIKAVIT